MCIVTDPHEPKHVTSDLAFSDFRETPENVSDSTPIIFLEPEDNDLYFESNTAITNKEICQNTKRD